MHQCGFNPWWRRGAVLLSMDFEILFCLDMAR
jgi:hypothetical protein